MKTAIVDAITNSIESIEGKYLRSILEVSYFPLKSLILVPSDFEVAQSIEEFFRVHEAIDKDFKNKFFSNVLQKEYQSRRGSLVLLGEDFSPEIQFDKSSIEQTSEDEKFQISLKGRKILFRAEALLGAPVRRQNLEFSKNSSNKFNNEKLGKVSEVTLLITDGEGHKVINVSLPTIIGRSPDEKCSKYGFEIIPVNSKYISRHQIIIIPVMEDICYFVPEEASLTCATKDSEKIIPSKIYKVNNSGVRLYCGHSVDHNEVVTGNINPAEYPVIELRLPNSYKARVFQKTPQPRLK